MSKENSFSVPEPPVGFKSDFLAEYWKGKKALPRMKGLALLFYYLKKGFQTISVMPMSSFITISTTTISVFFLAGFMLLLHNVDQLLSQAGTSRYLTAYISDTASDSSVNSLISELERNPKLKKVIYTSKEDALKQFRNDLGSKSGFLYGLDEENPLPSSVDIIFTSTRATSASIEKLAEKLRKDQEVITGVVYGSEWVDRLHGMVGVFRYVAVVSIVIAIVIVAFLMGNTIKLVIYARRDELAIMKLVGASDSFVKIPFTLGGLFQGLLGAVLGLCLLKLGFTLLNFELKRAAVFGLIFSKLEFITPVMIIGLLALGLAVGAVGSLIALRRFIRV